MASSQPSPNVELEAAKFLHKLIQDSKDEPAKLATKLYVILQHMKSSGKEHSMPYQVISRAMETVIHQHNLDIEALMSSRLPLSGATQMGDSATPRYAGSAQAVGVAKDSKTVLAESETSKIDPFASSRLPVGPSGASHDYYQGSGTHRSSQSFDHESPSSLDTRSANSQSQERGVNQRDGRKASAKRKRIDSSLPSEPHTENAQKLDVSNSAVDSRKGKTNKVESSGGFPLRGGENTSFSIDPGTGLLEVTSAQSSGPQGMALPPGHETHSSRAMWNQNKAGLPSERSQVPRFPSNTGNLTTEIPLQGNLSSLGSSAFSKVHGLGGMPLGSSSYPMGELGFAASGQYSGSENQKLGLPKGAVMNQLEGDDMPASLSSGKVLESDGGSSHMLADANKIVQGGRPDMAMMRTTAPRDMGKFPASQGSGMPFKEQQLKQLRAQCLVFLAFRNGLMPKKLHLEIALGNIFPKDDGLRKEMIDYKGKAQSANEQTTISDVAMQFGRPNNAREAERVLSGPASADRNLYGNSSKGDNLKMEDKNALPSDLSVHADDRKNLLAAKMLEAEMLSQETVESQAVVTTASQQLDSAILRASSTSNNSMHDRENGHLHVRRTDQSPSMTSMNNQLNPEAISWTGVDRQNDVHRGSLTPVAVQHELISENKDNFPEQGNEDNSAFTYPHSPKYTMSEKWIVDHQRKKLLVEQNWVLKQQKTKQRMVTSFNKLKDAVNSSEDISAKTKSVIELKKLQLLELQRRLRSDFLSDFFKPITTDMDRLKAFKKHKHGRRIKQLEKYEQKMKEERQKRIRERQKEFFAEIEAHKERLDDVFKIKRERWKGFNKYVKEYHKRKERIHREKIDRIQREKINLLKINDVEGYLRMVQDAKSDRVKQLLKETEKYLQKLGSKLQQAKATSNRFENEMDDVRTATVVEKNEIAVENEDESDQAKHFLESNEKYYLMAHSIKENITEQPSCLQGGKLREYQMNGLRWLVSLYNNHLNGILADEMGLGKTVQVISLICYLMEAKNDRGPFLVVVPSSVLPGWEMEINFWAPGIHKIVYSGPPEERRKLFKEKIVHQKFNVLLTTYEYLMNKHDRPKLSKIQWHYIVIDEGHRIKNASCKLNADLKHYRSYHRLLLTGTPLQNNLEELWALLNFLLPSIFNSSEDFSQWFNKPFESNGDNSADEALLSEEENLLIINRLHQVLRPFVLRRLKHKVENQLPEKIERLIRCEASAYQKLLMKRVEDNLGAIGNAKARSVHNSVMELRNICNHPYLSQLHADEVDSLIPKHFLPPIIRLCGKLEMLDRLLPKLKATDHRILFFSTMTRLLDIMEEYLVYKKYLYLRLDGHTSGGDRGALIDRFNAPGSPYFIFLLSIRAGGVGVNLQAADTVIIFDTDWNPQVDLQAQARAHRIGQKKDVLVLRFETVQTVEEQVRASAEHKLGVANQSITAGFFDNNTSAEDRREYLESLLRECKKEEAAPVLDDDSLNDILARSENEIDIFESVDKQRREEEMVKWKDLLRENGMVVSEPLPPLPSRLVTDGELKAFYEMVKLYDVPKTEVPSNVGLKRKGQTLGGLDTQHYGRGKRAREVRSYEEQWTEEEFEKMCQADSPDSPKLKEEMVERMLPQNASGSMVGIVKTEPHAPVPAVPPPAPVEYPAPQQIKEATPPSKRGRGRPRRVDKSPIGVVISPPSATDNKVNIGLEKGTESLKNTAPDSIPGLAVASVATAQSAVVIASGPESSTPSVSVAPSSQLAPAFPNIPVQSKGRGRKAQSGIQPPRRRGKKQEVQSAAPENLPVSDPNINEKTQNMLINPPVISIGATVSSTPMIYPLSIVPGSATVESVNVMIHHPVPGTALGSQSTSSIPLVPPTTQSSPSPSIPAQIAGQSQKIQSGPGARRRGRKQNQVPPAIPPAVPDVSAGQVSKSDPQLDNMSVVSLSSEGIAMSGNEGKDVQEPRDGSQEQASSISGQDQKSIETSNDIAQNRQLTGTPVVPAAASTGPLGSSGPIGSVDIEKNVPPENNYSKVKVDEHCDSGGKVSVAVPTSDKAIIEVAQNQKLPDNASPVISPLSEPLPGSAAVEGSEGKTVQQLSLDVASNTQPVPSYPSVAASSQLTLPDTTQVKRQGRKAPNRVETPRRRGRKPASVSADVSSNQDPKLNPQSQNKSRDSVGSKAMSLRSKQESDNRESQNVVQINAFGRIQTADVTDVARVMKEIFSETCSSKAKVGDSSKSGDTKPLSSKMLLDVAKNQSSEDKTSSVIGTLEAAAPVTVVSTDNSKMLGSRLGAKMEEDNNTHVRGDIPISTIDAHKIGIEGFDGSVQDSRLASSKSPIRNSDMEAKSTVPITPYDSTVSGTVDPADRACSPVISQGAVAMLPGRTDNYCGTEMKLSSEIQSIPGAIGQCAYNFGSEAKASKTSPKSSSLASGTTDSAKFDDVGHCSEEGKLVASTTDHSGDSNSARSTEILSEKGSGQSMEDHTCLGDRSTQDPTIGTKPCSVGEEPEKPLEPLAVGVGSLEGPAVPGTSVSEGPEKPLEPLAVGVGSLEGPAVSGTSDALCDQPLVTTMVSRSDHRSANVESGGSFAGNADVHSSEAPGTEVVNEAIAEVSEDSKKSNGIGADLELVGTSSCHTTTMPETDFNQDNVEGRPGENEDEEVSVPEVLHSVTSDSTNLENHSKDNIGLQFPQEVKNADAVREDGVGMQGGAVDVCNVEEQTSYPKVMISESFNMEKDHSFNDVQLGIENGEGKHLSLPSDGPEKTANIEFASGDRSGAQVCSGNEQADKDGVSNMQIMPSVSQQDVPSSNEQESSRSAPKVGPQINVPQETGIELQHKLEDALPSSMSEEQNTRGMCKNDSVSSSVPVEVPQASEAKIFNQTEVSKFSDNLPRDLSENSSVSLTILTAEEEKNKSSDQPSFGCSVAPEESKGSEAEVSDQMDVSHADVIVQENTPGNMVLPSLAIDEKKVKDLLEVESKVSDEKDADQMDASKAHDVVPAIVSENMMLSSCSSPKEDDKVEGEKSKKGSEGDLPVQMDTSPTLLSETMMLSSCTSQSEYDNIKAEKSKESEADLPVQMDASPTLLSETMMLSACISQSEDDKVEAEKSKEAEADLPVQMDASPTLFSETMMLSACTSQSEDDKVEAEKSKEVEADLPVQMDACKSPDAVPAIVSENMVLTLCSSQKEDDKVEAEKSKGSEADLPHADGSASDDLSERPVGTDELKSEGLLEMNVLDQKVTEEPGIPETERGIGMAVSQIIPVPESALSNAGLPLSASVMQEREAAANIEEYSEKSAMEETKGPEVESCDEIVVSEPAEDVEGLPDTETEGKNVGSESGEGVVKDISEACDLPSSSPVKEEEAKIEEKSPVGSPKTLELRGAEGEEAYVMEDSEKEKVDVSNSLASEKENVEAASTLATEKQEEDVEKGSSS